jgi:dTDP-4-dehydrorhamnose 3,5-epimerase
MYGIGYLALSDVVIFHYKQNSYYKGSKKQFSYKWDDPKINIWLPIKNPILSTRDG